MRTKWALGFLFCAGLVISACAANPVKVRTVEVTRLVPKLITVEIPQVVRETQVVTSEATRPPRKTQLVTVIVPHVVRETQIVTAEVTRIVRETVIITVSVPSESTVDITQGISLQVPRAMHTATRLLDGRILVVGGSQASDEQLADVEIYDPLNGFTTRAASLHTPRHEHSATLLLDGRVLVVGGYNLSQQWLSDAEIYDPAADTWTVVPPLFAHGVSHTATRMSDGRVLVAGGCISGGLCTERVEIFDPQTDSWIEAAPFASDRASHTAVLLEDGRVLVAGGGGAGGYPAGGDALIYDPQTNTWTPTGPMVNPRIFGTSVRLLDGRVLVAGGIHLDQAKAPGPDRTMLASVEIYDPATNTWAAATDLPQGRYAHGMVMLQDGRVLVAGGARDWDCCWSNNSFLRGVVIYEPLTNRWYTVDRNLIPGTFAAAVLLDDGRVWVTGGRVGQSGETYLQDTWFITVNP